MADIIEHNDYDKPVDGIDVIEVNDPKIINDTERVNRAYNYGIRKINNIKLFKVFEGICLDPKPMPSNNSTNGTPYEPNYCSTDALKSKYLEQMTILFKRINTVPSGQLLLQLIADGIPVKFKTNIISQSLHKNPWTYENSIYDTSKNLHKASCIIRSQAGYLDCEVMSMVYPNSQFLNTVKQEIKFPPDLTMSWRIGDTLFFQDPAAALYHELTHVLHDIYGVNAITFAGLRNTSIEEYLTFGGDDKPKIEAFLRSEDGRTRTRLEETARVINQSLFKAATKKYFAEKYCLTEQNGQYIVTNQGFTKFLYHTKMLVLNLSFIISLVFLRLDILIMIKLIIPLELM